MRVLLLIRDNEIYFGFGALDSSVEAHLPGLERMA